MPVRRSSIVLAGIGVVLIVLGVLVRFVVVRSPPSCPRRRQPGRHLQRHRHLLDGSTPCSPVTPSTSSRPTSGQTVDRRLKVTGVHGDTAIVSDDLTIHAGSQTLPSDHTYALDRTTLQGVTPPPGIAVEPWGALSSTFPMGAGEQLLRYYDSTTRGIVPISYTGHATRDGRSVNVYTIASTGAVKDELLDLLPPSLPKKLIATLAPAAADRRAGQDHPSHPRRAAQPRSRSAIPGPPASSPTSTRRPASRSTRRLPEQVVVNVAAGAQALSLIPVLALDFHATPASVTCLASKAKTAGELLTLIKVIVPIVLVVIGVVLLVIAILRRRGPAATPAAARAAADGAPEPQPESSRLDTGPPHNVRCMATPDEWTRRVDQARVER